MLVVDVHCHAGPGDGFNGPWDTHAHLERYLRRARGAGIDRTVVISAFHSDYQRANREVGSIVRRQRTKPLLWAWAFVHAQRDTGRIDEMIAEALEMGFCGIKVHGADARITREVCEAARASALPVLYDAYGDIAHVGLVAAEFPEVEFIIPHLGSFADRWDHQLALIDLLERQPNVFTDTSGVRRFDNLVDACRRAGPRKILFGSDGPWHHPGLELAKIHALGLSQRDHALVAGGNACRILGRST